MDKQSSTSVHLLPLRLPQCDRCAHSRFHLRAASCCSFSAANSSLTHATLTPSAFVRSFISNRYRPWSAS